MVLVLIGTRDMSSRWNTDLTSSLQMLVQKQELSSGYILLSHKKIFASRLKWKCVLDLLLGKQVPFFFSSATKKEKPITRWYVYYQEPGVTLKDYLFDSLKTARKKENDFRSIMPKPRSLFGRYLTWLELTALLIKCPHLHCFLRCSLRCKGHEI